MDAPKPFRRWSEFLQSVLAPLAGKDYDPETLRSVPSWGLSVLLHALLLLILALLIRSGRPAVQTRAMQSQLGPGELSDLTSLVEASQAGDPFTKEQTSDPPSLGLEPVDPEMKFHAQPEIPGRQRFGPELAGPRGSELGNVALLTGTRSRAEGDSRSAAIGTEATPEGAPVSVGPKQPRTA